MVVWGCCFVNAEPLALHQHDIIILMSERKVNSWKRKHPAKPPFFHSRGGGRPLLPPPPHSDDDDDDDAAAAWAL